MNMPDTDPIPLVGRRSGVKPTPVRVGTHEVGGTRVAIMAGPCSIEDQEQVMETARAVKAAGAVFFRGSVFKPRTSPYTFQGLGEGGTKLLAQVKRETGLLIVTELMDVRHLPIVAEVADILQVGSRSMSNFTLLDEVGRVRKPVLLKRGMSSTLAEFLLAAERIALGGNREIILCERGIRTFETSTRNTLDLNAVPWLKRHTHLPVIVDPSHGTGHWWMVGDLARAAVAAGCDGLLVEVHVRPDTALSDGEQSLSPENFENLMLGLRPVAAAVGRTL